MNYDVVLKILSTYLSPFPSSPEFLRELAELISGSGVELSFFRTLVNRLNRLTALGAYAAQENGFESLGRGIFSMHIDGRGFNDRILYAFLPNRQPVLLLAFHERGGKKSTDYSGKIPIAISRFDKAKEDYNNEPFRV